MSGDAAPARPRRRPLGWIGLSLIALPPLLLAVGVLLWWQLPRWAPAWSVQRAPLPDMALRGLEQLPRAMSIGPLRSAPLAVPPERLVWIFRSGLLIGEPQRRMRTLRLLMQESPHVAAGPLRHAIAHEQDVDLLTAEILLLGLQRDAGDAPMLARFLESADPRLRAAAADAIGVIHRPLWGSLRSDIWLTPGMTLRTALGDIPRPWSPAMASAAAGGRSGAAHPVVDLPDNLRERIRRLLADDGDAAARDAAARALVGWPQPGYRLRIAEWGVWAQSGERLAPPSPAEMPPCVVRCWVPPADLDGRVQPIHVIFKPVMHLAVDRLMAIDVEVAIRQGQPWFAAPRPDDYAALVEDVGMSMRGGVFLPNAPAVAGPPAGASGTALDGAREGYPWLDPAHRIVGDVAGSMGSANGIAGIGLRWQSLVAAPEPLPWMSLPAIGDDPLHAWWLRLRETPRAWVANRGACERFVFYDGPTNAPCALQTTLTAGTLCSRLVLRERMPDAPREPWPTVLLRVDADGVRGAATELGDGSAVAIDLLAWIAGDGALDLLRQRLLAAGLDRDEAEALLACWPHFTRTPGLRCIALMPRAVYDDLLPLRVEPAPTELVRVGLVLAELGDAP